MDFDLKLPPSGPYSVQLANKCVGSPEHTSQTIYPRQLCQFNSDLLGRTSVGIATASLSGPYYSASDQMRFIFRLREQGIFRLRATQRGGSAKR